MAAASELTQLGQVELEGRLAESRRELFNLRFQLATGQLDNSARLGIVRRDVARILTVLREREIAEAEAAWSAPGAAKVGAAPAAQGASGAREEGPADAAAREEEGA
jgi:large subunit ribosomal protein L29